MKLILNNLIITSVLFLVVASFSLTSCNRENVYHKEISLLDSFAVILNNDYAILEKIEQDSINDALLIFNTYRNNLDSLYTDENQEIWKNELTDIYSCQSGLERYLNEDEHIRDELKKSITQIESLIHDLENNILEQDKVDVYVMQEINSAQMIINQTAKRGGRMLYCLQNTNEILSKTDSIIDFLKKEN